MNIDVSRIIIEQSRTTKLHKLKYACENFSQQIFAKVGIRNLIIGPPLFTVIRLSPFLPRDFTFHHFSLPRHFYHGINRNKA